MERRAMSSTPLRIVDDAEGADPEGDYIAANLAAGRWSPEADRIPAGSFDYHARTVAFIERHIAGAGSVPALQEVERRFPTLDTQASGADIGWVADQMRRHRYIARVRSRMVEVADAIVDDDADAVAAGLTELAGITGPAATGSVGLSLTEVVEDATTSAEPMPTHSDALNAALRGGIRPGQFALVAARLSVGKTFWMLNSALAAARQGRRVYYFTLEMTAEECLARLQDMILDAAGTPRQPDWSRKQTVESLEEAGAGSITLTVGGLNHLQPTPEALEAVAADHDAVYVDYMGLMRTASGDAGADDWRIAASIATRIQQIGKKHHTAMVSAAQLNRDGRQLMRRNGEGAYDPTPGVDKIAQTDVLGQSADVVIMLERLAENVTGCWLAKHRNGRTGTTWFSDFDPAHSSFADIKEATALLRIEESEAQRTRSN